MDRWSGANAHARRTGSGVMALLVAAALLGCGEESPEFYRPPTTGDPVATETPDASEPPRARRDAGAVAAGCDLFDDFEGAELDDTVWGVSGGGQGVVAVADGAVQLSASGNDSDAYIVDLETRSRAVPAEISFTMERAEDLDAIAGFRAILFSRAGPRQPPYQPGAWEVNWFATDYTGHHAGELKIELIRGDHLVRWIEDLPFDADTPYEVRIAYDADTISLAIDGVTYVETDTDEDYFDNGAGFHHFGFWDYTGSIDDFCYREL